MTGRTWVAEAALERAARGPRTPAGWLARAVSARSSTVVDIACGGGAMSRELASPSRTVVGVDLSYEALRRAVNRGPGPWLQADARRLPLADGSADAVTSCMGVEAVADTDQMLAEVARVLAPGGAFAFMVASVRPLQHTDVRLGLRLAHALRSRPLVSARLEASDMSGLLRPYGLRKVEDRRELYHVTVRSRADAELMIQSLYAPTTPARLEAGIRVLGHLVMAYGEAKLALPLRRVVAIK